MAVISAIIGAVTAAATAISSAVSAAGAALATSLVATTAGGGLAFGAGAAGAAIAAGGASVLTVGGVLAGVGLAATAAIGLGTMYKSARASAKAQKAQQAALQQLSENSGKMEVNETARTIQDNSRFKRTLSSLRIPLGITPKQKTEEVTQNVYGVDTNTVATATQNMTGLNIAAA